MDLEQALEHIEYAIKEHERRDNMYTASIFQTCHRLISELKMYKDLEEQGRLVVKSDVG